MTAPPDVLPGLSPDLGTLTAAAVYAVVFGFVFVESGLLVGFLLPGDSILFGAGLLSAEPTSGVSLVVLAAGAFAAAVAGDSVGYGLGNRFGRAYVEGRVARGRLDVRHLHRTEQLFARWGWWAVVVARWIPWIRTFTPVLAGTGRMPYPRFLSANLVGALAWAVGLTVLGHVAASQPALRHASYAVAGLFIAASSVAGVIGWVRRRRAARQ